VDTAATDQIPVDIAELWDDPPASLLDMLPPLYLMLDEGHYSFAGVGTFALWWDDRVDDDISYWWWFQPTVGDGTGNYVDMAIGGAPHVVDVAAQGSFNGGQMSFPADWETVTATIGALNVNGTLQDGQPLVLATTPIWDDVPDQTISGTFPDPDALGDAIYRSYDDWTLTYGNIQVGPAGN
jgi:hypothetical protein